MLKQCNVVNFTVRVCETWHKIVFHISVFESPFVYNNCFSNNGQIVKSELDERFGPRMRGLAAKAFESRR